MLNEMDNVMSQSLRLNTLEKQDEAAKEELEAINQKWRGYHADDYDAYKIG